MGNQRHIGGVGGVDSFVSLLEGSEEDILNIAEGLAIVGRGCKHKGIAVISMVTQRGVAAPCRDDGIFPGDLHVTDERLTVHCIVIGENIIISPGKTMIVRITHLKASSRFILATDMEHQNAVCPLKDPAFGAATLRAVIGRIGNGCFAIVPGAAAIFRVGHTAGKGANIIDHGTYREHKINIGACAVIGGQLNAVRIGKCIVGVIPSCAFAARQGVLQIPGLAAVIRGKDIGMHMGRTLADVSFVH